MKRYKITVAQDTYYDFDTCEEEDPDGEWVKYKSVLNLLGAKSICNCKESVAKILAENSFRYWQLPFFYDSTSQYWICSAHGYKKI